MAYYSKTKAAVHKRRGRALGIQLAKLALARNFSVQQISEATGASRSTVYNWFAGTGVTNAYRAAVAQLIENLTSE